MVASFLLTIIAQNVNHWKCQIRKRHYGRSTKLEDNLRLYKSVA